MIFAFNEHQRAQAPASERLLVCIESSRSRSRSRSSRQREAVGRDRQVLAAARDHLGCCKCLHPLLHRPVPTALPAANADAHAFVSLKIVALVALTT